MPILKRGSFVLAKGKFLFFGGETVFRRIKRISK